ncbi:MAG TPA: hypothetical protein VJC10_00725 [Patescibacteria group bacterium]|nr:hypothetical protein [Patescibacteria group bacterium]
MKLFSILKIKRQKRKAILDHPQEMLIEQGRRQFKRLLDKGLQVPVALL